MKILNGLVSMLCLVGHVMSQGRFYRSQFDRGSGGSRDSLRGGRSRTAEFFNTNLQLDNVAPFRGGSTRSRGFSGSTAPRGFGGSSVTRGFSGSTASRGFGGSSSFSMPRGGQGIQEDPSFVRQILGSTVAGREMRMGERGLPRHGGAGIGEEYSDGRNNGWDGNPQTLTTQYQGGWSDPFQGRPIPQVPVGFSGDFGSIRGMFGSAGLPPFRVPSQFL
ncbi:collagen alpha-2(I) chain-like isoform X2 [Mercenaria mercenaria]|uniref:collagen alpha-2(I) chain-like isoform X2 n=1 Tax=Mercenaria mercenaria TaxID=6596 RepID=UPI001E1D4F33|nr:collagen alpha-2(I) chain-like isoform X2 [Mercenaria mercenaria]